MSYLLEDKIIAAKPDAKSEYITRPAPYSVFTKVNRKETMNTHHANIAGPEAGPNALGTIVRAYSGILPERPVERFSGIRSSGQCCRPMKLTRIDPPVTALRIIRGRSAVHGMRS